MIKGIIPRFPAKHSKRATGRIKRKVSSTGQKRATEADLKRLWNVPVKTQLRYKGIKGILWYRTSISVRQRDMELFDGECIDMCGSSQSGGSLIAGTSSPPSIRFGLLFDEKSKWAIKILQ